MSFDPYLDLAHGVLRNRLGLTDAARLAAAEAELTALRLYELERAALPGAYDLAHLQAFHHALFQDVYAWAGELRTVAIGKGRAFCPPQNLRTFSGTVFTWLADAGHLRDLSRAQFLAGLTTLLAHVNELHPFREGNGRAQRAFLAQLAREAGHPIRWAEMAPEANVAASRAAMDGDNAPLRALLEQLVA